MAAFTPPSAAQPNVQQQLETLTLSSCYEKSEEIASVVHTAAATLNQYEGGGGQLSPASAGSWSERVYEAIKAK